MMTMTMTRKLIRQERTVEYNILFFASDTFIWSGWIVASLSQRSRAAEQGRAASLWRRFSFSHFSPFSFDTFTHCCPIKINMFKWTIDLKKESSSDDNTPGLGFLFVSQMEVAPQRTQKLKVLVEYSHFLIINLSTGSGSRNASLWAVINSILPYGWWENGSYL